MFGCNPSLNHDKSYQMITHSAEVRLVAYRNERIVETELSDAKNGKVVWSPKKSIWVTVMYIGAVMGGVLTFSIEALVVFVSTMLVTLCLGHSLGMHS